MLDLIDSMIGEYVLIGLSASAEKVNAVFKVVSQRDGFVELVQTHRGAHRGESRNPYVRQKGESVWFRADALTFIGVIKEPYQY